MSGRGRKPGGSKGYRRLPSGNYQIRVSGFPPEVIADELAATLRVAELRIAKREGHALPTPAGSRFRTLGQAAEEFLAHKLAHGGKHGELTEAGQQHWELSTRPWRDGPLRTRPLRALTLHELSGGGRLADREASRLGSE